MPKPLRIALPLLLLLAVYGGSGLFAVFLDSNDAAFFIWTASVLIFGAANVVNAILDRGEGAPRRLAFWNMLLKLCTIPFYLIVFVGGMTISIAMAVVPGLIFGLPIVVAVLAAIDYGLLLFTSSYGIAAAVRAGTRGVVTDTSAIVLCVLHLLFVADVVAAIVLYVKIRKAESLSGQSGEGPVGENR